MIIGAEPSLRESVGLGPADQPPTTWEQWELDVLCEADDDGCIGAMWQTKDYFQRISRLFSMQMRGLLCRRDGRHGGPWKITDAGREYLRKIAQERTLLGNRNDGSGTKKTEVQP